MLTTGEWLNEHAPLQARLLWKQLNTNSAADSGIYIGIHEWDVTPALKVCYHSSVLEYAGQVRGTKLVRCRSMHSRGC